MNKSWRPWPESRSFLKESEYEGDEKGGRLKNEDHCWEQMRFEEHVSHGEKG